jgi:glycosyltransferase involved in cell wall biosynthesis
LYDRVGSDLESQLDEAGIPVAYLGKRLGFDPRVFARLGQVVRTFQPDVVHTHLYVLRYALPVMLLQRISAKVHTVHTMADQEVGRWGQRLHSIAFRQGIVPVSIAQEVSASLRRVYGLDAPLIPNGIPVKRYQQPAVPRSEWRAIHGFNASDIILVSVARFYPPKNQGLLVEAFHRGGGSEPRTHLLLVGEGPNRRAVEQQVQGLGLQDRVHFLGLRTDIPEILAASDIFALTSDWEGNPLSVMEAMAAGKPAICTSVGGVSELVQDGTTGLLVNPGDAEGVANAMRLLTDQPALCRAMGEAGSARANSLFDVAAMTNRYMELYQALLHAREARAAQ